MPIPCALALVVSIGGASKIPLGAGSYLAAPPAGAPRPTDMHGRPVQPRRAAGYRGAPPTNRWYSSLVWPWDPASPFGQSMYPHPLALAAHADGLGVAHVARPAVADDWYSFHLDQRSEALRIGAVGLVAERVQLEQTGDWTVTTGWEGRDASLHATFGRGLPSVYVTTRGAIPRVVPNGSHAELRGGAEVWIERPSAVGLTVGGVAYGLFGPPGSRWVRGEDGWRLEAEGEEVHWVVSALPRRDPAMFELFERSAARRVVDSRVSWTVDDNEVEVEWTLQTAGEGGGAPVQALLRHQWLHAVDPKGVDAQYVGARGPMPVVVQDRVLARFPITSVLPHLPAPENAALRAQVSGAVRAAWRAAAEVPHRDVYWCGKSYVRLGELAQVAHAVGETEARDALLHVLRSELEDWFTVGDVSDERFFAHDPVWGALIAYPDSYGSAKELNDHDLHYGYFVMAAAVVARFDPEWASKAQFGGMVDLLIRDVLGTARGDQAAPFLRGHDSFAGHSFASGHQGFAAGNNLESTSEALQLAGALILWGGVTGDRELQDLGTYLQAVGACAVEQYWFDVDAVVFPERFPHPIGGILWDDGLAHSTWFSPEPEAVLGINLLPLGGASLYLGRRPEVVRRNLAHLREQGEGEPEMWADLFWAYEALVDPAAARASFVRAGDYEPEAGRSRPGTLHWISSLTELGRLEAEGPRAGPTSATFVHQGTRTYVVYNASSEARSIEFDDGVVLEVAPRSLGRTKRSATREF